MKYVVARRLASLPLVCLGVALVTFISARLIPGDVVDALLAQQPNPEMAARLRATLGLDQSLHGQLIAWLENLSHGDLGTSLTSRTPVGPLIVSHLWPTMQLTAFAMAISVCAGISLGIMSGTRRNSRIVRAGSRVISTFGLSVPDFVLGVGLIYVFAVVLRWLPAAGYPPAGAGPVEYLSYLLMPSLALAAAMGAVTMRMTAAAMDDVLSQDYVRTAYAKGLGSFRIIWLHTLRNAMIPVLSVIGIQLGRMLGGAIVIENVFSWPGLGSLLIRSIQERDYPVIQGIVIVIAFFFVLASLMVDLGQLMLSPQARRN